MTFALPSSFKEVANVLADWAGIIFFNVVSSGWSVGKGPCVVGCCQVERHALIVPNFNADLPTRRRNLSETNAEQFTTDNSDKLYHRRITNAKYSIALVISQGLITKSLWPGKWLFIPISSFRGRKIHVKTSKSQ